MSRLVVVLPLQTLVLGDAFTLRDWPLHVTVAPTFVIAGGLPAALSGVTPILSAHRSLVLRVGPEEGFGHAMNVPVSIVEATVQLSDLHSRLVAALLAAGARFDDPEFVGAGYRPHVTRKGVDQLQRGDRLTLRQAAVVDMAPVGDRRVRRVVWTTELS